MKIESNVPMPKRGRQARYPFNDMDVGNSFAIPAPDGWRTPGIAAVRSAATKHSQRTGMKFESHIWDGEFRLWRTA